MKTYLLIFLVFWQVSALGQTRIVVDASVTYQTIHGFGASDAWNFDPVGKHWSDEVKEDIARRLFAKTFDLNGNPEGIGLSRWRFNVGAGSAGQDTASHIQIPERRAECFLNEDGTYDWTQQKGQQWFLNQAVQYGVENLVAFVNSPPRFYTKNGRANSDNADVFGPTNLKDDQYESFASFITTVLKHFDDEGVHFSQISPINEPQFAWRDGQEGCPWLNPEILKLTETLNRSTIQKGLSTKILLAEASGFKDLYEPNGNAAKCDQISYFFDHTKPGYLGNLQQMLPGIGGHSYWTDTNDTLIREVREKLYRKSLEYGPMELYQTEYCLLSNHFNDYLTNAIFLGKIIYADLAIANVSVWDYWTAIDRERWGHMNRFYLIRLIPDGGNKAGLTEGGTIMADKNLWVLGQYSFFIRPGYKRIKVSEANDLSGLMCSAYMAPDHSKLVAVFVNWDTSAKDVSINFVNLPTGKRVKMITPYVTDVQNNMAVKQCLADGSGYTVPPRSVTTWVVELND